MGCTHHDGLSVYGSGLWRGTKGIGTSGDIPFFGYKSSGGAVRCDGGVTNVSAVALSVSTNLSTVITVFPTVSVSTNIPLDVFAICSGNSIDIKCYSASGTASSGVVSWIAFGY
jgi:hypothetical protein